MSTNKVTKINFIEALNRLKEVTGMRKDKEIAELIGLNKGSLAMRIQRDSFPENAVDQYCYRSGLNPEFIKFGVGPKHFFPGEKVYDDYIAQKEMSILNLQGASKEIFVFEPTLARIKEFLNLSKASDSEIGRRLGVKRQSMEAYRKNGYFPASRVVAFCRTHKASVDWILSGDKAQFGNANNEELQKVKDELLEVYRENSELKSRIQHLEKKIARLEKRK